MTNRYTYDVDRKETVCRDVEFDFSVVREIAMEGMFQVVEEEGSSCLVGGIQMRKQKEYVVLSCDCYSTWVDKTNTLREHASCRIRMGSKTGQHGEV